MHGVDTNVIVRFLTGDNPAQAARARRVIREQPVFVSKTVLLEVQWVLRAVYDLASAQILPAMRSLAGLPGVSVEDAGTVAKAIDWAEAGMDFAIALHLASSTGRNGFMTFDKRRARAGTRLSGIPITPP